MLKRISVQWLSIAALAFIIGADGLLTTLLTIVLCRSRTGFKSYVLR